MSERFNTSSISGALRDLEMLSERAYSLARRSAEFEEAKQMKRIAVQAQQELRKLEEALPRLLQLSREVDRAYDRRVTGMHP